MSQRREGTYAHESWVKWRQRPRTGGGVERGDASGATSVQSGAAVKVEGYGSGLASTTDETPERVSSCPEKSTQTGQPAALGSAVSSRARLSVELIHCTPTASQSGMTGDPARTRRPTNPDTCRSYTDRSLNGREGRAWVVVLSSGARSELAPPAVSRPGRPRPT